MSSSRRLLRPFLVRVLRWIGVGFAVAVVVALILGWRAFGHFADGERRARMEASPQWSDGKFRNPQPLVNDLWGAAFGVLSASPHVSPAEPPPTVSVDPRRFDAPPPTGLRATWLGHSTVLVEVDGHRFLTDPIWSGRSTPIPGFGPRRSFTAPIAIADLPDLTAVVISHDHYDHLDYASVSALNERGETFVVPLGVGAHLEYWGVPPERIRELDWWEQVDFGEVRVTCTPARHAAGRMIVDDDANLWAGWAIAGPEHRVYYSGDTGLFPAMAEIGARLGPFDLTMIEVGQYGSAWPDWHIGPEQAVIAHRMVRGRVLLPVHWGTFALAYHAWTEPIERVLVAADAAGVVVVVPRPGQGFEPADRPALERWWPDMPWHTAAEDPIVSTMVPPP